MIETDSTFVVKGAEEIGISDERLVHLLKSAEDIRAQAKSRNQIIELIRLFSESDDKESIMEGLMMAYFAGNQSKNPRKIKKFVVHKKELE
jgi:hypothetical protein